MLAERISLVNLLKIK